MTARETGLEGIEEGLTQWEATMRLEPVRHDRRDTGHIETWAVAYHMEAGDSPLDDLILAVHYQDDVV